MRWRHHLVRVALLVFLFSALSRRVLHTGTVVERLQEREAGADGKDVRIMVKHHGCLLLSVQWSVRGWVVVLLPGLAMANGQGPLYIQRLPTTHLR
jgi:hypothetical protein